MSARNVLTLNGKLDIDNTDVYAGESVGVTCAFCHSISDGSVFKPAPGQRGGTIGKRVDGRPTMTYRLEKQSPRAPIPVLCTPHSRST